MKRAMLAVTALLFTTALAQAQDGIRTSMDILEALISRDGTSKNEMVAQLMGERITITDAVIVKTGFEGETFFAVAKTSSEGGIFALSIGFMVICATKSKDRITTAVSELSGGGGHYNITGQWSRFDDTGMVQALSLDDCAFEFAGQ